jgi:hypothetical protein
MGERRYRSTHSLPRHYTQVIGQLHARPVNPREDTSSTHRTRNWMGPAGTHRTGGRVGPTSTHRTRNLTGPTGTHRAGWAPRVPTGQGTGLVLQVPIGRGRVGPTSTRRTRDWVGPTGTHRTGQGGPHEYPQDKGLGGPFRYPQDRLLVEQQNSRNDSRTHFKQCVSCSCEVWLNNSTLHVVSHSVREVVSM